MEVMNVPGVAHRFGAAGGVRVFYRGAGPPDAPTMLLLHGFPSAPHQFRRLIDALGSRYWLIVLDYPGFRHSDAPAVASIGGPFAYTLDRFVRFVMYVFDFGAPVGFRLSPRHSEWVAGLVVQNGNAYDEGLSAGTSQLAAFRPDVEGDEEKVRELCTLAATRGQYIGGTTDPELIAPDGWTHQHFPDLPGLKQIQVDVAFDYHPNLELYPRWQAWLREHTPPTLITDFVMLNALKETVATRAAMALATSWLREGLLRSFRRKGLEASEQVKYDSPSVACFTRI